MKSPGPPCPMPSVDCRDVKLPSRLTSLESGGAPHNTFGMSWSAVCYSELITNQNLTSLMLSWLQSDTHSNVVSSFRLSLQM